MTFLPQGPAATVTFTPQSPAAIVLRRNDRVLVTLTENPDDEELAEYAQLLGKSFPGVQFVVLGNVAGLAVYPHEPGRMGKEAPE